MIGNTLWRGKIRHARAVPAEFDRAAILDHARALQHDLFEWEETPQGFEYWQGVHGNLLSLAAGVRQQEKSPFAEAWGPAADLE